MVEVTHGLEAGALPLLPSSHFTEPRVRPAMSVLGFLPSGRAGNISSLAFGPIVVGGRSGSGGLGAGWSEVVARVGGGGVIPAQAARFWPLDERVAASPRAGNAVELLEELPVLPTALPQLP